MCTQSYCRYVGEISGQPYLLLCATMIMLMKQCHIEGGCHGAKGLDTRGSQYRPGAILYMLLTIVHYFLQLLF